MKETRLATLLYPSNPILHARLAEASADLSVYDAAVEEAEEALRLDGLLKDHPEKQLPPADRERLEAMLDQWREKGKTR